MLAWASSKATSLLLVALLLVGGFAVLTDFRLKLTQKDLQNSTDLLEVEKDKFSALQEAHTQYRQRVENGTEELAKILKALEASKKETTYAINQIRLYPSSPVLDTPFPAEYLRMRRAGSADLPTAGEASSGHKQPALPKSGQ